jgi:hypothetical protein
MNNKKIMDFTDDFKEGFTAYIEKLKPVYNN